MTSRKLDFEFKNALVNSELRDSLFLSKDRIDAEARVVQSMPISTVGMQCGMQSSMTSSVKLERNNAPAFRHT